MSTATRILAGFFACLIIGLALPAAFPAETPTVKDALEEADRMAVLYKSGRFSEYVAALRQKEAKTGPSNACAHLYVLNELANVTCYNVMDLEESRRLDDLILGELPGCPSPRPDDYVGLPLQVKGYVVIHRDYVSEFRNQTTASIREAVDRRTAYRDTLLGSWNGLLSEAAGLAPPELRARKGKLAAFAGNRFAGLRDKVQAMALLAQIYYSDRDIENSLALAIYCLEKLETSPELKGALNFQQVVVLRYILYHCLLGKGFQTEALEGMNACLEAMDVARSRLRAEESRANFFRNMEAVANEKLRLHLSRGEVGLALASLEQRKSITLKEMLAGAQLLSQAAGGPAPAQGGPPAPDNRAGGSFIRGIWVNRNRPAIPPPAAPAPAYDVFWDKSISSGADVGIANNEVLVEFFYGDDELDTFVLTAARPPLAIRRKIPARDLEGWCARFKEGVSAWLSGRGVAARIPNGAPPPDQGANPLRAMYALLFEPALKELEAAGVDLASKKLVLVAFGELNSIPLHALCDQDGRSLLDRFAGVAYYPSAQLYVDTPPAKATGEGILAVGVEKFQTLPPLSCTLREAESVAAVFPRGEVLGNEKAVKSAVREKIGPYAVLHLATHAVYDESAPVLSRVFLNGDGDDANNLHACEFLGLGLKGKMVVLSACQTGLQKVCAGDDLFGFERYILAGGATAVLSSLWSVDDQAAMDFMVAFYREFRKSGDGAAAWKQAATATREKHRDLYKWAPFKYTGR